MGDGMGDGVADDMGDGVADDMGDDMGDGMGVSCTVSACALRPQPSLSPSLPQPSRHLSHSEPYPLRPQPSRHPSLPQCSRHPPRVLTPPLTFTAPTLRSRASRALLELGNANKLHKIGSL